MQDFIYIMALRAQLLKEIETLSHTSCLGEIQIQSEQAKTTANLQVLSNSRMKVW